MKNLLVYAVIGLGVIAYNVATQADRDAGGNIVDGGSLGAFTIRLGDCFDNTSALASEEGGEVSSLPGVPCSDPHDNEVYAVFDVSLDAFPGRERMTELAETRCTGRRFEDYVGVHYDDSVYLVTSLSPTDETWNQLDDREITCIAVAPPGESLTGSIRDTER